MTTRANSPGGGIRHHLRKLFVLYVAFATGCSNSTEQYVQSKVVENSKAVIEQPAARSAQPLPDLGSSDRAQSAKSAEKPLKTVSAADLDWMKPAAELSSEQRIADPRQKGYQGFDAFQSMAMGIANSAAAEAVTEWFGGHRVTADVQLGVGTDGLRSGSFDLLVPVYDVDKDLVFIQGGARRSNMTGDTRTTINLGAGYRRTFDEWMLGFNSFYDRDLTGRNERIGFGAEAWTDNLKLSANTYHRLSDWKQSADLDDYLERPANGWDVRAEGYLPNHPQLGGRVMYEQYYGDEVGLFGSGSRQKDPSAATVGVIYNPIPLLNVSADYRRGQGGESDTTIKLGLNYKLGESLAKQLSPESIIAARSLENARYNLVQRNNEIVLDYQRKESGQILLPAEVRGLPGSTVTFPVTVTSQAIRDISWTASAAPHAQVYNGSGVGTLTIPAGSAGSSFALQAVGTAPTGAPVMSNMMMINVDAMSIALESSKASAMADGTDAVVFTATVMDPDGQPKPDAEVVWAVDGPASIASKDERTNNAGRANLKLVSTRVASVRVQASEPTGATADAAAAFTRDPATARVVGVVATPTTILANGSDASTLVATVEDSRGESIGAGVTVTWSTTRGSVSPTSSITDDNGMATAHLTGTQIGAATVMASAVMGSDSATVTLITDTSSAGVVDVTATPPTITAGGDTTTLTATVKDAHGNPVGAGVTVTWSTTGGNLSATTSVTDADGKATVTLSGNQAGTVQVTGTAPGGSSSVDVTIQPDASSARVIALVATPAAIAANGSDVSTLVATVGDAYGNAVRGGVTVTWSTTVGNLSASTSVTDASGKASVKLSGTKAGDATVTASAVKGSSSADVRLMADTGSSRVVGITASPTTIVADGAQASTLVATVEDAQGNPVGAGVTVTWSTTGGSLSASSSVTDASGKATVQLTSTQAGAVTVTGAAVGGSSTAGITVIPDASTARVVGLTATPAIVAANGSASSVLVATVEDAHGNPMSAGVSISWTATLGSLSASSSMTDTSGKATVQLTSTKAGGSSVTASAVAGSSDAQVTFTYDNATSRVVGITASPTTIVADGAQASTLVATVEDAQGNPVGAGVTVTWSTTGGSLSASSSVTDASGKATVQLTSTQAGAVTVTGAAVGGSSTAGITVIPDASTARVVGLTATPAIVAANGSASSVLVATVEDAHGNPMSAGVSISWTATLGSLSASSSVTNASGKATVQLTSTKVGQSSVTAAGPAGSDTASVQFVADSASARVVSLLAAPDTIVADGVDNTVLTAMVEDAQGNPVGAGVTVTWSTTSGSLSASSSVTDATGKAFGYLSGTQAGAATVTATAAAGQATAGVTLIADASTAKVLSVTASPSSIVANGVSGSTLTATVVDAYGNALGAGIDVTWSATAGTLSHTATRTNASGKATVALISGLDPATSTVTASALKGAAEGTVVFTVDQSKARIVSLTASPASIAANGTSTSTITATLQDDRGNSIGAGVTVNWGVVGGGSLSAASSLTNASGIATVVLTSSTTAGIASVRATANRMSQQVNVAMVPDAATAQVESLRASDLVPAGKPSDLVAIVKDAKGNPMGAGYTVIFSTTFGNLSASTAVTDASSQASLQLNSTAAGVATINAKVDNGDVGKSVNARFIPDTLSARVTQLTATPSTITADGSSTSALVAKVTDAYGNAVGAGVVLNWTTSAGSLSAGSSTTDDSGSSSVTLKSSSTSGTATVTAAAAAGSSSADVKFTAVVPEVASWRQTRKGYANWGDPEDVRFAVYAPNASYYQIAVANYWGTIIPIATQTANGSEMDVPFGRYLVQSGTREMPGSSGSKGFAWARACNAENVCGQWVTTAYEYWWYEPSG